MSDEQSQAATHTQERPAPDGFASWSDYWTAKGMPWRTEAEIDEEQQQYLTKRRAVKPEIEKGIYPFRDEKGGIKLARADVEWLLASHGSSGLDLRGANLRSINLSSLPLVRLRVGLSISEWSNSPTEYSDLAAADLEGSIVRGADLRGATLLRASLIGAKLRGANLAGATLVGTRMNSAILGNTHLEDADLREAHLEGTDLTEAHLQGANLRGAFFDTATDLDHVHFGSDKHGALVSSVHWGDADLALVEWSEVRVLGDEYEARHQDGGRAVKKGKRRLQDYARAVRANRRLSVALHTQGLRQDADRFAYRAQVLQRQVLRRQRRYLAALGSWLLDLISGYGYKPGRSFIVYVLVILAFAAAFFALGAGVLGIGGHEAINSPVSALVFSVTSFHGRGFFPGGGLALDDPITILAAFEAIMGLFIEITFIATFTQRFFAR